MGWKEYLTEDWTNPKTVKDIIIALNVALQKKPKEKRPPSKNGASLGVNLTQGQVTKRLTGYDNVERIGKNDFFWNGFTLSHRHIKNILMIMFIIGVI